MSGTERRTVWRGFRLLPQGSAQGQEGDSASSCGRRTALCSQESSKRVAQAFLTHGEPTRRAAAAHQNPPRARPPAPPAAAAGLRLPREPGGPSGASHVLTPLLHPPAGSLEQLLHPACTNPTCSNTRAVTAPLYG